MNILARTLLVAACAVLAGCAANDRQFETAAVDASVDVVGACEQALYYPQDSEDEQAALACGNVIDIWR